MRRVFLVSYIVVLLFAGLTSPNDGVLGEAIGQIGSERLSLLHIPAFGLLCWLVVREFVLRGWPTVYAWFVGMSGTFVFGLWLEVFQGSIEGRMTMTEDLVIDAIGIALAALLEVCRIQMTRPRTTGSLPLSPG